MSEGLPKIVLERLRMAEPGGHPDADLLTAFAERTLLPRERDAVLQHLAACVDCREAVSLATPEQAVVPPFLPVRTNWLSWPYLRWGAALACVVVVGAAVTLRQQHAANQPKLSSAKIEQTAALQPQYEQRDEPAPAPQERQDVGAREKPEKDIKANRAPRKVPAAQAEEAGQRQLTLQARNYDSHDQLAGNKTFADSVPARAKEQNEVSVNGAAPSVAEKKKDDEQREYLKMAPAPISPAPMAPASETVTVMAESVPSQTEPASVQKAQATGGASAHSAVKAPGVAAGNLNKMSDARTASQLVSVEPAFGGQWTLSPEGLLQRSLDSGATWNAVAVAPNVHLRAVSALGNDLWVGGAGGALFHSSDNGVHWTQVRPRFEGKILTGDIIGLEFKDLAHGQITTTYELWTTSDAGKTWLRTAKP
jgi:Photosynthesis system II assembly factor YCF48/Putative zinc-finger